MRALPASLHVGMLLPGFLSLCWLTGASTAVLRALFMAYTSRHSLGLHAPPRPEPRSIDEPSPGVGSTRSAQEFAPAEAKLVLILGPN